MGTLSFRTAVPHKYITSSNAITMYVCMVIHMAEYGSTGKVANPARGQLNREKHNPLSLCVPESLVSRDGFSRPVPRQPVHLHTQAESGAYVRDSSPSMVGLFIRVI